MFLGAAVALLAHKNELIMLTSATNRLPPPIVGGGVQIGSTWQAGHSLAYCTFPG
jgi:hypothetical protein